MKAHYQHTGKRSEVEWRVAARGSVRELGVFDLMYVLESPSDATQEGRGSAVNSTVDTTDSDAEAGGKYSEENYHIRGDEQLRIESRNKRRPLTGAIKSLTPEKFDGIAASHFHTLLEGCHQDFTTSHYVFRRQITSLRVVKSITIQARYPWVPDTADKSFVIESLKGFKQFIRATGDFFGEPIYDFVEYQQWNAIPLELVPYASHEMRMGQVRVLFVDLQVPTTEADKMFCALIRIVDLNTQIELESVQDDQNTRILRQHCEAAASQPVLDNPRDWNKDITRLFAKHGCARLRWALDDSGRCDPNVSPEK